MASPSSPRRSMVELVLGTGVVALMVGWLLRQIIEGVGASIQQATNQTLVHARTMGDAQQTAMVNALREVQSIHAAATGQRTPTQADAAFLEQLDADNPTQINAWWNSPAFDPMGPGLDPTDGRILEGDAARLGVAYVEPGASILDEIGAMPGGVVPDWVESTGLNFAGEMIPEHG